MAAAEQGEQGAKTSLFRAVLGLGAVTTNSDASHVQVQSLGSIRRSWPLQKGKQPALQVPHAGISMQA